MHVVKAPKLQSGDTMAIISPSSSIADRREALDKARATFERGTGLQTITAPNCFNHNYYAAGTVQDRLDDFHWALTQPDIKGIIFSVGGKNALELVDRLNYDLIRQNPKVITGISDASTLLNPITHRTGLITFLGTEFFDYARQDMPYEVASMRKAWFDGELGKIEPNPDWKDLKDVPNGYSGWQCLKPGAAEGIIVGGNFPSYSQLIHTDYGITLQDGILALEMYKASKRNIHWALAKLKLWGIFDQIAGLLLGYSVGSDDPEVPGNDRTLKNLVEEVTDGYDFPVLHIGEVGHHVENIMLPIGAKARLDATNKSFEIIEPVTIENGDL